MGRKIEREKKRLAWLASLTYTVFFRAHITIYCFVDPSHVTITPKSEQFGIKMRHFLFSRMLMPSSSPFFLFDKVFLNFLTNFSMEK